MPESTDAGGRKPRVTDADLLDVFRETADPVLSTAEVSDALPIKRRGTLNRLRALEAEGRLDSKTVGGRNTVWWLAGTVTVDEGRRETATDAARSDPGNESGEDTVGTDGDARAVSDPALVDAVDRVAEDALPGSGAKLEARREALHAAVEYLRERGTATPKDFRTDVYPDHPGRYTAGDDPGYSWWTNCIYKGLRELAERTDLVEKADTSGEWSWRGGSV